MVKTKVNGHMIGKIEWNEQALIDSDLAPSE